MIESQNALQIQYKLYASAPPNRLVHSFVSSLKTTPAFNKVAGINHQKNATAIAIAFLFVV